MISAAGCWSLKPTALVIVACPAGCGLRVEMTAAEKWSRVNGRSVQTIGVIGREVEEEVTY